MKIRQKVKGIETFLYRTTYYTIGFSTVVGIGNGLASTQQNGRFDHAFGEGFVNNVIGGLFANMAYSLVLGKLEKSKNFRLYANLANFTVNAGMLAWHFYAGTENPISASTPAFFVGAYLTNKDVTKTQRLLEEVVKNE